MSTRFSTASALFTLGTWWVLGVPTPGSAQTLQGRVVDEYDDGPVASALVRLLDESGEERAITAADAAGLYRITAPEPGVYRVIAERLGYEPFETPLLEARNPEGVYALDLLMRPAPIPIAGVEVSAAQADREVRQMIGISPRSLRVPPVRYETIQDHVVRGHDLIALLRWGEDLPLNIFEMTEGPCVQARGRGCLPVYLNSFFMNPALVPAIPLDVLHTIVVVFPSESITYPNGAVLLYTEAWLR